MLDKLAKKNVIHKNKASNQKSKLAKVVKKVGTVVAKKSSKKKA
jgi:small subunit ribosomal protein S20